MKPLAQNPLSYTRIGAIRATAVPGATIDLAIRNGELRVMKTGHRMIILHADLMQWLLRCRSRGAIPSPGATPQERVRFAAMNRAKLRKRTGDGGRDAT